MLEDMTRDRGVYILVGIRDGKGCILIGNKDVGEGGGEVHMWSECVSCIPTRPPNHKPNMRCTMLWLLLRDTSRQSDMASSERYALDI